MQRTSKLRSFLTSDVGILILLALGRVLLQVFTNGTYGFHQDELVTLDIALRRLDWGYVAWPPITPFLARLAYAMFGLSPIGLRVFAVLAEGAVMLLSGLMVRELGGSRWAQVLAAVAVATAPMAIIQGGLFQYETLDYLCWVLLAFVVMRLLKTGEPRWWLAIGAVMGLGMMTKYTIAFLIAGVIVGLLATLERHYLRSPWLWAGAAVAFLVWLPNLIWQARNHWISLSFLASIHARDVSNGLTTRFLLDQWLFNLNPAMLFLVLAGLYYFFFSSAGRRFRMIGWMYLVPFILLFLAQGKGYYLGAAYPMLAAGGAAWWESRLTRMDNLSRARGWKRATWGVMSVFAILLIAVTLPVAPLGSRWWEVVSRTNGELKSEVGWPELAGQVAQAYHSLPTAEQSGAAILAESSGEIGAIDLYGPAYGLPKVISGFDSYWQFGFGDVPPRTVIVVGYDAELRSYFADCRLYAPITVPFNVQNDEAVYHKEIHICHDLQVPWSEGWQTFQSFG